MLTARDLHGVMATAPTFATPDADSLEAASTVDVDNLAAGLDRIIRDGVDIISMLGSFGECYNLFWDEFKTVASTAYEVVDKRVPLFIGSTSQNPREAVQKLKFIRDLGGDGSLLGVPYYDLLGTNTVVNFYKEICEMFPDLGILVYHNPENHKFTFPVSIFNKLIENPNIIGMKDSHRDTRSFMQLQRIIKGKISVFVNQTQLFPYVKMGAAGCWSIDAWMGPWPVLHLRNLVDRGDDEEAQRVTADLLGGSTGARVAGQEDGGGGTTPQRIAGYIDPGPSRRPTLPPTEAGIERATKRAAYWEELCDKYRPLVEAEQAAAVSA